MSLEFKTYGCKVNTYDTGLMQKRVGSLSQELDDIIVLNTCAVTAEASKEAQREIRRIRRDHPHKKIVVTGCAAQVDTEMFVGDDAVDLLVANSHKAELAQLIEKLQKGELLDKVYKSNIFKKDDLGVGGGFEKDHTRSFLKIQDGCNSFCTFCVIPFARGKSRSLEVSEILQKVNELYREGVKEIVVTGIHIGDYEAEHHGVSMKLPELMNELLEKSKMPRFRISSLEPIELSQELLKLYRSDRMCPHFHMSIQSANSKVLREMKRNYQQEDVVESLSWIKSEVPQAFVGMDVIAGFPGESEEEFLDTYQTLDSLPWTRLHVFPYSSRPGTFAHRRTDQLERSLVKRRSHRLRELSAERYMREAQSQVGQVKKALLLKSPKGRGLSTDYWSIDIEESLVDHFAPGTELLVKITDLDVKSLQKGFGGLKGSLSISGT